MTRRKPLYGKMILQGTMRCVTGLHIGAAQEGMDIGGLDAPVVRDPITRQPYIPGSSVKGKLRHLFERKEDMEFNRFSGQNVWRHECADPTCAVCRLFGATAGREGGDNLPARLTVRDMRLTEDSVKELEAAETGLQFTEWKFENALDRITAAANPRQIERVPAGARFTFELVYNLEADKDGEIAEDLTNVLETMSLLEDDSLGGHGSRGYGKVGFEFSLFEGRKINYYAAITDPEREAACISPEVKSVADCKKQISSVVNFF